jgi:hypothetical protein
MRPPNKLKLKRYFYWGSVDSADELHKEMESIRKDSKETRILTVGGRHYIYYVPNVEYWRQRGYSGLPEDTPPSLWHALPV